MYTHPGSTPSPSPTPRQKNMYTHWWFSKRTAANVLRTTAAPDWTAAKTHKTVRAPSPSGPGGTFAARAGSSRSVARCTRALCAESAGSHASQPGTWAVSGRRRLVACSLRGRNPRCSLRTRRCCHRRRHQASSSAPIACLTMLRLRIERALRTFRGGRRRRPRTAAAAATTRTWTGAWHAGARSTAVRPRTRSAARPRHRGVLRSRCSSLRGARLA
eukprot:364531-Chlamydomonas_euryale.AAC.15